MTAFTFTKGKDSAAIDLSDEALARFAAALPGNKSNFTVTRELADAASEELLRRTRARVRETKEPFYLALIEMMKEEKELARICCAYTRDVIHRDNRYKFDNHVDVAPSRDA
jgi:hypothetical protein